jgi:glycosyltransferase involved in cell wall biosynthesis
VRGVRVWCAAARPAGQGTVPRRGLQARAAGGPEGLRYNAARRDAGGRGPFHPAFPAAMRMDTAPRSNESLRVMHVASGDLWAGAEVQVLCLATALSRLPGMRVEVVLLNPGELGRRLAAAGVEVTVLDESRLSAAAILSALWSRVREVRPDVVHTHRRKENVLGALAALAAPEARSLRTVHGAEEYLPGPLQWRKGLARLLDRLVGRRLQARVVAVSNPLAELLRRRFPGRVAVIENGIDVEEVRRRARAAVDLAGAGDGLKVAFVGRLVRVKRLDVFLEIAAEALRRVPGGFRFYVVGDGPARDAAHRTAEALGLGKAVAWVGFTPDAPAWLGKMDAMLVTSDHEGLPMNVLEALCLGVPVVAHAVGGIPEVLEHGKAGTLVEGQRPADFADVLTALRDDPRPFLEKADRGRRVVAERYGADRMAARYRDLYLETARPRRAVKGRGA